MKKMMVIATAMMLARMATASASVPQINLVYIAQIESSNRSFAYNKTTKAIGLHQITPVVLKEYNRRFKTKLDSESLFHADINTTVAHWYANVRIPELLRWSKIPITTINMLIAYHDGIGNLIKFRAGERQLGKNMKGYIKKYETLSEGV